jgi:transcriptional regulator with XRE-family HTH domain
MPEVNVGRRIREAREALDLNQHELAGRVGVSQRAVSYVEKQAWVKQSTLQKYARALGRTLSYFLRPYDDDSQDAAGLTRQEAIQQAFAVVCRDPEFGFGSRPAEQLSAETKQDIVRLYERCKGVSLLPTDMDSQGAAVPSPLPEMSQE